MSGEPPRPRNWFLYFRNTRPTSNFQSRLIVFRCEEQWEAIWDTMANNWNIKNIYIANDIIWHDENGGMERRVEIKNIFDIYIKILYLPHRAECSQAVLEGVLMRWHQQTLRCRGCSPRIIVCFILISGHRILLVTRDTRHWTLDTRWTTALAFHYLPNYEPGPFYNIYPGICWCQLPAPRLP